ncbi:DUF222 domain-containing protein [Rhodococcus sp. NPDC058481]|uniref:HNH endonuclease signature motif containing protein n=1 Tax=unclassified Rhodococcus (in: high G+C Gram-positive bacteria) TaxID=192944 RepID=UPI00365AAEB6
MDLDAMLTDPDTVDAWRLDETDLLAAVPQLSTAILKLEALRLRLVHEADQRALPEHVGAADTPAWLAGTTRMLPAQARRIVHIGRELPQHPQMTALLNSGNIALGHAQVITKFLTRLATLTKDLHPDDTPTDWDHPDPMSARPDDCEAYLLIAAQLEDPHQLRQRARALEILFERDGDTPPDGENPELNELYASTTLGGRLHLKGTFDAETGEAITTALSGLSKPRPTTDDNGNPTRDPRHAPKRRADALEDIVRGHLNAGRGPTENGERPHITITIDFDALVAAVSASTQAPATGPRGKNGWDYHSTTTSGPGHTGPDGHGTASGPGHTRPAKHGTACEDWNHHKDCTDRKDWNGRKDCTHCRPPQPQHRRAHASMPWLGPISPTVAARLSCDAMVTAIITDSNGTPLDVGTTTRIIPTKIRKALVTRDCGCAFPGCGRPAEWTDAHHIWHWAKGGPTALSNLVLLCRKHHTLIHKNHWDVTIGDDGHPWFTPPAWLDPLRRPRPAHNRRDLHPVA